MLDNLSLFSLASDRLNWLSARQKTTAENIANANTPDFKSRDVVSFGDMLGGTRRGGVALATSHASHLSGTRAQTGAVSEIPDPEAGRASLDGNNVDLEQQSVRSADIADQYRLAADLYRKGHEMLSLAVRRR